MTLFNFVQFEFTHAIGPHAGRYVVRPNGAPAPDTDDGVLPDSEVLDEGYESGDIDDVMLYDDYGRRNTTGAARTLGAADVLVVSVEEAEPAKFRWGRSKKVERADADAAPGSVPLLLTTFVKGTQPLDDERSARENLEHLSVDLEAQEQRINEGVDVVNRAVRAYRTAAGDPYVVEVGRRNARAVRIGFGTTNEVAAGRWTEAFIVPQPNPGRSKRSDRLRPGETTARILSGRSEVLEAEDLMLRILLDLDQGRTRAAALQAHAALALLQHELPEPAYQEQRESVADLADRARRVAENGVSGPLGQPQIEELEELIELAELHINRWRHPPR